jgi:hypothetical protein
LYPHDVRPIQPLNGRVVKEKSMNVFTPEAAPI